MIVTMGKNQVLETGFQRIFGIVERRHDGQRLRASGLVRRVPGTFLTLLGFDLPTKDRRGRSSLFDESVRLCSPLVEILMLQNFFKLLKLQLLPPVFAIITRFDELLIQFQS